jgi:hypothetical protein
MSKTSIKNIAVGIVTSLALMMTSFTAVNAQGFISSTDNPQAISTATQGQGSFRQLALTIVNFFLTFLGLIAVVMIIYGGFLYVSAAGNSEKIENAKKIIMYAVIGIIVILLSFAIVNTILTAGSGGATT